jgi:membrane associated rhomboid family serine protease
VINVLLIQIRCDTINGVTMTHPNYIPQTAEERSGAPVDGRRRPGRSGLVTPEWLAALRHGRRPMPATITAVTGCVAVSIASLATGGSALSGSVHGAVDHYLARNAALIASGEWWRALSYGTLNLSLFALVYVMVLLVLAGLQIERTYGTVLFLAILAPSWTAGALSGLLVEPAHAFNAGTSAATFGVATAATIDLLRRGVPWFRTFWAPNIGIVLVLGFIFPASVTWGAHVGGIIAGAVIGAIACDPRTIASRRRLAMAVLAAGAIVAASLVAVPFAARHTTSHGPILIGAQAIGQPL